MTETEVILLFKALADKSRLQILKSLTMEDMYVERLAQRLDLTGHCQNLPDGDVLAQIQGPDVKIQFLLAFMESLKRIRIRRKIVTPMTPIPGETGFRRL